MSKYSEFYIRIKELGLEKEAVISDFTEGRTESIRDLSQREYNALCASLRKASQGTNNAYTPKDNPKGDKLRKAIISCFHQMHFKNASQEAKMWAERMGVGSGEQNVKKLFNHYTNQELMTLLQKAEKAVSDYKSAVRKRITNA